MEPPAPEIGWCARIGARPARQFAVQRRAAKELGRLDRAQAVGQHRFASGELAEGWHRLDGKAHVLEPAGDLRQPRLGALGMARRTLLTPLLRASVAMVTGE